ncbi:MAG: D-aminoacyl-tRNA deacylase [Chloroflexi bacterium]|nr:D-aminoacyl-tRNA deacylase [Chloroflexota bacterium]
MEIVDTHCHLDLDAFAGDRERVLGRAEEASVGRVLVPGLDLTSTSGILALADSNPHLFAAVGVHPNSARTWRDTTKAKLGTLARHPKVVAVGEIGLDYYRHHAPHNLQRQVFKQQLALALELELPIVIHVRNASQGDRACLVDLLAILEAWQQEALERLPALRGRLGVVHSFSGNLEEARQITGLGFYLGISGPVTYKNSAHLRKVVASVPLERLLVETDAPFLTPHPHRGKRNEPAYVKFVVEKISEVRGLPLNEVAKVTTRNAGNLFLWNN